MPSTVASVPVGWADDQGGRGESGRDAWNELSLVARSEGGARTPWWSWQNDGGSGGWERIFRQPQIGGSGMALHPFKPADVGGHGGKTW